MLIPAIDLRAGRVVQLVQGEREALAFDAVDEWVERFRGFSRVQVIDLDAAKGTGDNRALLTRICRELPCRVGGGLRSVDAAARALAAGAEDVIIGSALFLESGIDEAFAAQLARACGQARVIGAVDARRGQVVVRGWRDSVRMSPAEAVARLEPWCGGFLYTHVDTEGLMNGIDMSAVRAVRAATTRSLTAAGGIRTWNEVHALDALGVDAVVGMAVYTGAMALSPPRGTTP
jgi:phosphoribosylformimino-5-aminoimidazole carboxamide ribotide isomerase